MILLTSLNISPQPIKHASKAHSSSFTLLGMTELAKPQYSSFGRWADLANCTRASVTNLRPSR